MVLSTRPGTADRPPKVDRYFALAHASQRPNVLNGSMLHAARNFCAVGVHIVTGKLDYCWRALLACEHVLSMYCPQPQAWWRRDVSIMIWAPACTLRAWQMLCSV